MPLVRVSSPRVGTIISSSISTSTIASIATLVDEKPTANTTTLAKPCPGTQTRADGMSLA